MDTDTSSKIKCDYILMILNCHKYRYKAELQTKEWISSLPSEICWFHIIGNPEIKDDFIYKPEEHLLIVKTPDDYVSLPMKVIYSLKAIYTLFDFQYVFKTDDDQTLIFSTFFQNLLQVCKQRKPDYGGHLLKVPNHYSTYHTIHSVLPKDLFLEETLYATGRFYLLSKLSVESLLLKIESISKKIIEDHAIGLHLHESLKINSIHFNTSAIFKDRILS
jgi:hypothetical protein